MGWDWWDSLSPLARYVISTLVIAADGLLMREGLLVHGAYVLVVGTILLFLSGRSEMEKRGYRNW
ncbi:MAG: hypothetical protein H6809_06515 [Phycisphaeraceae bacterium]|nr:hypothetical protein [Phycisphaeraceae bacterium]